jgi:uncharacterized membrane protein YedE/YeeE
MMPSLLLILTLIIALPIATVYGQEATDDILALVPFDSLPEPVERITTEIASFAAERGVLIIGALAFLAFFYVVGKVAGSVTTKIIDKWAKGKLAQRIQKNVKESGQDEFDDDALANPKNLIPKTVSWFFYLIGIVGAVNTLGLPEFADALAVVGLWIPKLIAAIVIIVLGSVLVKFALAWIVERKWFGKESDDYKTMSTVIVYSMVIAIALTTIDIGESIIPILVQAFAYALAGAFIVAVGWGMKDFVPSWWMGRENKSMGVKVGNEIETRSDKGTIDKIGRSQFRVKTESGKFVIIPHKDLLDVHFAITAKDDQTTKN